MNISKYKKLTVDFMIKYKIKEFTCQNDYLNTFSDNTTDLDDLMFYFYCIDKHSKYGRVFNQHIFRNLSDNKELNKYEKQSTNYLRKEKLQNIKIN